MLIKELEIEFKSSMISSYINLSVCNIGGSLCLGRGFLCGKIVTQQSSHRLFA